MSKIGEKKRIAGKKNRWEKKQNRLRPSAVMAVEDCKRIYQTTHKVNLYSRQ